MTRDEILGMKPGRELDAWVAEKVMGLEFKGVMIRGRKLPVYKDSRGESVVQRDYSTSIEAAWEVVERTRKRFRDSSKTVFFGCHENLAGNWTAYWYQSTDTMPPQWEAISESLPEALCKASLLAVMGP